jgi:hypothetical protein
MLLNVRMPHEPFNTLLRQGKVGALLGRVLDDIKPEAVYFSEQDGKRGVVIVVDVKDQSRIPSIAEPFFLCFNADCHFHIAMSPYDLKKAGLEELGKKWA